MAPVLGYWNIRGLAQPIRLMLAYTETKYEDKRYVYGPPPDFDRRDWLGEKLELGLDFPNLPYYIDGNTKLTQSITIMRYLARKLELDPTTEEERIRADLVEQQTADFRMALTRICYSADFENLKTEYLKTLPTHFKNFSAFLGNRKWLASADKLTYVDFMLYEAIDHNRILEPDCLKHFPTLKAFMERFEELPTIKKYMESDDFIKYPLNGDMAAFGSRLSKKK
ncbi:glutathione S-transferase Mu 1-like [Argiope bruennichi]|uniref:Glutathione S-transferase n=1 Tax=Argiope bruennichi TaxID=94029 RepID=A0A8T0FFL1_ARGBR|nr:glutathione S-transferase Mu 1-like [Argiope bruennichi]KAF8790074.1 Glutathione S-transferase Mu 5 like protein [Argiope bruennichi]